MIKISSMYALKNWLKIICVCSIFIGCATNQIDREAFRGEGYRASTPSQEDRAVVWGNHSGAVEQAVQWLNDHQILVLYRWAETDLDEQVRFPQAKSEPQAHLRSVAYKVGAPLVVFVQVNEKLLGKNVKPIKFDDDTPKTLEVEIRGMNTETADAVFGAKVWNVEPAPVSEKLVMDLTTFALEKALNEPQPSLPLQQKVHQNEKRREQVPGNSATMHREISQKGQVSQPIEDHPALTSQISDGSVYTGMGEKRVEEHTNLAASTEEAPQEAKPQTSYSDNPNEDTPSSDSSVGLQVASGALSVLYTPIKVVYAVLGGFFGGFAYVLTGGNEETASSVWDSSLGGTYFLRPGHLSGDKSILFMGESSNIGNAA